MIRAIIYFLVLSMVGCTPTINYGRRSVNEPLFTQESTPPSLIVSSTKSPAEKVPDSSPYNLQFTLENPKSENIEGIKKAFDSIPEPAKANNNLTVLKRTIIATVSKGDYRPADRFVNYRLRITPTNFSFTDYKASLTDYTTINIEKLELKQTNSASMKLTGGKAEANISAEKSLTESGDVSTRLENLTVNIDNQTLDIYREAERGIDLAGNTLVNIGVTALDSTSDTQILYDPITTETELMSKDGEEYGPDKASIKIALLQHIKPQDLTGAISFNYVIRRVLEKTNEYSEHNQKIYYEIGSCNQKNATIVRAQDFLEPLWYITDDKGFTVELDAIDPKEKSGFKALTFTDKIIASDFANWMMRHQATKIGKQALRLSLSTNALNNPTKYPVLTVKIATKASSSDNSISSLICNINKVVSKI